MEIRNIRKSIRSNFTKVEAELVSKNGRRREMFFEVSGVHPSGVSGDGSAFIAACLPMAMARNECLEVEGAVSAKMASSLSAFVKLLHSFNPRFKEIEVSSVAAPDKYRPKRIGGFFSAGVDSFYVYLKNKVEAKEKITDFILVMGFDVPLADTVRGEAVSARISQLAKKWKINLVTVRTNLRELVDQEVEWDWQVGAALGSVALLLRPYFKTVYIGGLASSEAHIPYGTHPDLDPLLSSERTTIVHDGAEHNRLERVKGYIARSAVALDNLRVCWRNVGEKYNCGTCEKCLRTMIELRVAGVLDKAKTFKDSLSLGAVRGIRLPDETFECYYTDVLRDVRGSGHDLELEGAVEEMLRKNRHPSLKSSAIKAVRVLDSRWNDNRLFWFLSRKGVL